MEECSKVSLESSPGWTRPTLPIPAPPVCLSYLPEPPPSSVHQHVFGMLTLRNLKLQKCELTESALVKYVWWHCIPVLQRHTGPCAWHHPCCRCFPQLQTLQSRMNRSTSLIFNLQSVVLGPGHNKIFWKHPMDQLLKKFLWGTSKKFQADVDPAPLHPIN